MFYYKTIKYLHNFYKYKRKCFLQINYQINQIKSCAINNNNNNNNNNNKERNLNILFFGTDEFSLPTLRLLIVEERQKSSNLIKQLSVVTSFKGSTLNPVRKYADQNNLKCFGWPIQSDEICNKYDLGIVVSFGHLIPEEIIASFKYGMINVHASLLPRWRGAAPIIYAIKNGDEFTGVTVMKIRPKHFDIGEVISQRKIPIPPDILMPKLHGILANEGAKLLINCLEIFPACLSQAIPQSEENISYAPRVQQSLTEINWNKMTALEIHRLYRALYSFKYLTTTWNNLLVRLIEISLIDAEPNQSSVSINKLINSTDNCNNSHNNNHSQITTYSSSAAAAVIGGTVNFIKGVNYLKVMSADGNFIAVHKIALEGKRIMTAADFNNGYLKKSKIHLFV